MPSDSAVDDPVETVPACHHQTWWNAGNPRPSASPLIKASVTVTSRHRGRMALPSLSELSINNKRGNDQLSDSRLLDDAKYGDLIDGRYKLANVNVNIS